MSFTPQHVVGLPRHYGFTLTGMTGTVVDMVSAPATATVPGAWVELCAALPFDTQDVEVQITLNNDQEESGRFWLGIGPGGSERTVGSFLRFNTGGTGTARCRLPWGLPRGARVAVAGHINTTNTIYASLRVWPRHPALPAPPQRWIGAHQGPTWMAGFDVTLGTEVYGAWAEAVAATPWPVTHLALPLSQSGGGGARRQSAFRVGVGGSGGERLLWDIGPGGSAFWGATSGNAYLSAPVPLIPAGSRLAMQVAAFVGGAGQTNLLIGG